MRSDCIARELFNWLNVAYADIKEWAAHTDEYYQKKHKLKEQLEDYDRVIAHYLKELYGTTTQK